jgi:hypothetical protein
VHEHRGRIVGRVGGQQPGRGGFGGQPGDLGGAAARAGRKQLDIAPDRLAVDR